MIGTTSTPGCPVAPPNHPQAFTLLWALRSPCNLGCTYCYFGTVEEHRADGPPTGPGQLSHLGTTDLPLHEIEHFAASLADPASPVERIFLAGGEPLIWPPSLDIIDLITRAGVQVVVCTNGIPLNRPHIRNRLVSGGVAAVSVSLDHTDPTVNDHYRPARNRRHGWADVINGIRTLIAARGEGRVPKVGIYAVITRQNLDQIVPVAELAVDLGCDYYVPQPVSLPAGHALEAELTLTDKHVPELAAALAHLYETGLPLALPDPSYPDRIISAVSATTPGYVPRCFGGRHLYFIEPDGSLWPCPSGLKIAATPPQSRRTIQGSTAAELFHTVSSCTDCSLFSVDCVNMWPLMDSPAFPAHRARLR